MFYPLRGARKNVSSWTNIMNDVFHLWLRHLCSYKWLPLDLKISCSLELFINAPNVYVKFTRGKYSSWRWICLILHTRIVLAFSTMLLACFRMFLHVYDATCMFSNLKKNNCCTVIIIIVVVTIIVIIIITESAEKNFVGRFQLQ